MREFRLDGSASNELQGYLNQDFNRFVYTLNLLPAESEGKSLLEIGSNPYFTSMLIEKFTSYDLQCLNFFGGEAKSGIQIQANELTQEWFEFDFLNHKIEDSEPPLEKQFDVVIFCEVIEHLIENPVRALQNIKNKMKPDGTLILSTPNVNRLENITKMIAGVNIYDPYSGHGPYGRHNREYNKHELFQLLDHMGFTIEQMFSSDVHENHAGLHYPLSQLYKYVKTIPNREYDLGQYIFITAKNDGPAVVGKPSWLFRSYPDDDMV